jgi:hypothetical protein
MGGSQKRREHLKRFWFPKGGANKDDSTLASGEQPSTSQGLVPVPFMSSSSENTTNDYDNNLSSTTETDSSN